MGILSDSDTPVADDVWPDAGHQTQTLLFLKSCKYNWGNYLEASEKENELDNLKVLEDVFVKNNCNLSIS